MIILDASATAPLILPDEAPRLMQRVELCLERAEVMVPQHWRLEVLNLGLMAVRRRRLDRESLWEGIEALSSFRVIVDEETDRRAWEHTRHLAAKHRLTAYDAAYLELAIRNGMELATFDGELKSAAQAEGITVLQ